MDKVRRSDQFFVYAKAGINTYDYQVLSVFYLPLIGPNAFALFSLLVNLMNRHTLTSERFLHSDLESTLNIKLAAVETARHHLEAIGLLNVYFYNDCFAYEIKTPMSPSAFVNDGILGQYLQTAVSEDRFKKLINIFKLNKIDKTGFINVTKSFEDIFPSIKIEHFEGVSGLMESGRASKINIHKTDFDFRLFSESIPTPFLDNNQLNDEVKAKIINLSYVYDLDEIAMKDVYLKSINDQLILDITKLSRFAREAYKTNTQKDNASEAAKSVESAAEKDKPSDPVAYFKTVSPRTLLSDLSGGLVSGADLRIIERLIDEVKLDRGVVNVLVAYTVKNKDGVMPSFDYFEKVGMTWKRNQIETVESAIEYVNHLISEFNNRNNGTTPSKKPYANKPAKPEVQIDWLDQYLQSQK